MKVCLLFSMMYNLVFVSVLCILLSIGDGQSLTISDIVHMRGRGAELSKHSENAKFHLVQKRLDKDNQLQNEREDKDYITREEFNQGVQEIKDSMADLDSTVASGQTKEGKTVAFRSENSLGFVNIPSNDKKYYFDLERLDIGNCFEPYPSEFTCAQKGLYMFNVHVEYPGCVMVLRNDLGHVIEIGNFGLGTVIIQCEENEVIFAGCMYTGIWAADYPPVFEGVIIQKLE